MNPLPIPPSLLDLAKRYTRSQEPAGEGSGRWDGEGDRENGYLMLPLHRPNLLYRCRSVAVTKKDVEADSLGPVDIRVLPRMYAQIRYRLGLAVFYRHV